MPDIRLPDGSVARFSDTMTAAEIERELQARFPPAVAPPKPVGSPQAQPPASQRNRSPRACSLEPEVEWAPDVIRADERPFPDRRQPRVLRRSR
jgi:hypothetical protein